MTMDKPCCYEIRVEGHLTDRWSEWFEGRAIHNDPDGQTTLVGLPIDQAALFGALVKIRDLNLTLVSVNRSSAGAGVETGVQAFRPGEVEIGV